MMRPDCIICWYMFWSVTHTSPFFTALKSAMRGFFATRSSTLATPPSIDALYTMTSASLPMAKNCSGVSVTLDVPPWPPSSAPKAYEPPACSIISAT